MFMVINSAVARFDSIEDANAEAEKMAKAGQPCVIAQVIGKVSATVAAYEVRKEDKDGKPVERIEAVAADVAETLTPIK
jgi:hypothetical protein